MKFAFADPPYIGWARYYDGHHADSREWDKIETHRALIGHLVTGFPDGWALCLQSPALRLMLPSCPDDCRVGAWVKPFCSFKPNVGVAYAWEPVIFRGGRKRTREEPTVRDWLASNITLQKGLVGAKPTAVCNWVLDVLGFDPAQDEVCDLFPGTRVMGAVVAARSSAGHDQLPLFADLPALALSESEMASVGAGSDQKRYRMSRRDKTAKAANG